MNIKGNKNFVLNIGFAMLVLMTSPAHAQWPTLDMTAIKESISSKVELVKQSKIVTEATQLAGKMNSTIGDAASSVSKFAGDNLQKVKDQAKKLEDQKKRLEENKKKIEDAKKKADEAKEKMEKAKKAMDDAKQTVNDAKEFAEDAKSKVDEAKQMAADVKSQVDEAKEMVSDAKEVAGGAIATAQDAVSSAQSQVSDISSQAGISSSGQSSSSSFVDDYVADYEASINSDAKIYEQPISNATLGGNISSMSSPNATGEISAMPSLSVSDQAVALPMDATASDEIIQLDEAQTLAPQENEESNDAKAIKLQPLQGKKLEISSPTGVSAATISEDISATKNENAQGSSSNSGLRKPFSIKSNAQPLQGATLQKGATVQTGANTNNKAVSAELPAKATNLQAVSTQSISAAPSLNKVQNSTAQELKTNSLKLQNTGVGVQKASSPTSVATPSVKILTATPSTATSATKTNLNTQGFRQRAIIKNNSLQLDKGAWLKTSQPTTIASYQTSSTLMFGAEDAGSGEDYIPDGVANNGEVIIPESLVWYCKIGVDKLEDPTVMENCIKELIRHQSDDDNQVAEEGQSVTQEVVGQAIVSATAESMLTKNIAANHDKVENDMEEQAGSASTTRDDSSVLALTNKEIQVLLNKLITIAATQLSLDAMNQISSLTKENLGEDGGENEDQGA